MNSETPPIYFMCWPSGAGGDFLLSLVHMINPFVNATTCGFKYINNQWDVCVPDYERAIGTTDVDEINAYISLVTPGSIGMLHIEEYTTDGVKHKIESLDNYNLINIYEEDEDILSHVYISSLYSIKCREIEEINQKFCLSDVMHKIDDAMNFRYRDIFIDQNPVIVAEFLTAFGRSVYDIDKVLICIQLYTELNRCVLYYDYSLNSDTRIPLDPYRLIKCKTLDEVIDNLNKIILKYNFATI